MAARQLATILAAGPAGYPPKKKKPRAKRGTAAEMKKRISEYRRRSDAGITTRASAIPLDAATADYALLLNERKKATARAAHARKIRNPALGTTRRTTGTTFADRYARKILGQKYRQGGRLLGAKYDAPTYMRRPGRDGKVRTSRVQRGAGLKKYGDGKYADLIGAGMNASVMRMGDYASMASLMDYAQLMRDKARAAYVARKRRMGKGSAIRTPMTKAQKKAKRAAAYRAKKATMRAMANSPFTDVSNNSSPMSSAGDLGDLSNVGDVVAHFSPDPPSPPRPRVTRRASASARAEAATRRARAVPSNRRLRSMV